MKHFDQTKDLFFLKNGRFELRTGVDPHINLPSNELIQTMNVLTKIEKEKKVLEQELSNAKAELQFVYKLLKEKKDECDRLKDVLHKTHPHSIFYRKFELLPPILKDLIENEVSNRSRRGSSKGSR